jgi:hypothetical protein
VVAFVGGWDAEPTVTFAAVGTLEMFPQPLSDRSCFRSLIQVVLIVRNPSALESPWYCGA